VKVTSVKRYNNALYEHDHTQREHYVVNITFSCLRPENLQQQLKGRILDLFLQGEYLEKKLVK